MWGLFSPFEDNVVTCPKPPCKQGEEPGIPHQQSPVSWFFSSVFVILSVRALYRPVTSL